MSEITTPTTPSQPTPLAPAAPALPAPKTYTEAELQRVLKAKLAAEAKVTELTSQLEDVDELKERISQLEAELELTKKESGLLHDKFIAKKPADW